MKHKTLSEDIKEAEYYDKHGVLKEIVEEPVEMSLESELRENILSGKRKRKLKNISVKIDPLQIRAIKKIATMKAIPYQTLIRHWLSQHIKRELHI
ncbi:MAG: hypothetical protein ACE5IH_06415 [Thermodesulfobacteriota bacterium]